MRCAADSNEEKSLFKLTDRLMGRGQSETVLEWHITMEMYHRSSRCVQCLSLIDTIAMFHLLARRRRRRIVFISDVFSFSLSIRSVRLLSPLREHSIDLRCLRDELHHFLFGIQRKSSLYSSRMPLWMNTERLLSNA